MIQEPMIPRARLAEALDLAEKAKKAAHELARSDPLYRKWKRLEVLEEKARQRRHGFANRRIRMDERQPRPLTCKVHTVVAWDTASERLEKAWDAATIAHEQAGTDADCAYTDWTETPGFAVFYLAALSWRALYRALNGKDADQEPERPGG